MSEFVEECRKEWRRLCVPDAVANEMAADLEADLKEAEAEGASAEEVLGSGAFDPRAFATAWATARGVVPASPPPDHAPVRATRIRTPTRLVLPFALCAFVVLIGLVLASQRFGARQGVAVSLVPRFGISPRVFPPGAPGFATFSRVDSGVAGLGLFLLVVGVLGAVATAAYWLWLRSHRSFRHPVSPG